MKQGIKPTTITIISVAILVGLFAVQLFDNQSERSLSRISAGQIKWQSFSDASFQIAIDKSRPIVVGITANWTVNSCLGTLNAVIESDESVTAIASTNAVCFHVDVTDDELLHSAVLERLGLQNTGGIPLLVVVLPDLPVKIVQLGYDGRDRRLANTLLKASK